LLYFFISQLLLLRLGQHLDELKDVIVMLLSSSEIWSNKPRPYWVCFFTMLTYWNKLCVWRCIYRLLVLMSFSKNYHNIMMSNNIHMTFWKLRNSCPICIYCSAKKCLFFYFYCGCFYMEIFFIVDPFSPLLYLFSLYSPSYM